MRLIGSLSSDEEAQRLCDFLYAEGMETQVDPGSDGQWEVWILDDDHLDAAQSQFDRYQQDPHASDFARGAAMGDKKRKRDKKTQVAKRYKTIDSSRAFYQAPVTMGIVTLALLAISVGMAVITRLDGNSRFVPPLKISDQLQPQELFPEVRQGQVWRLVTPIFIHFNILHILFNMLWLRDLGSVIEARKGTLQFLLLVLVLAVTSNVAQYLWRGPNFGGMSGVVYGLLGYVWMQGKLNPAAQLKLHPHIVVMMLIWLALGFTGQMDMANGAHLFGLLVGVAWGALSGMWARYSRHH
ncbi:rhomboid family intramembrane serine protease [Planctomycetota bacterium]